VPQGPHTLVLNRQITDNFDMLGLSVISLLLVGAASVFGVPTLKTGCDISEAQLTLPTNETAVPAPTSAPSFIGLAIGTQNYSCSSTGTYTNIGALAELFDVSCLYNTPIFPVLQDVAILAWEEAPSSVTPAVVISLLQTNHTPSVLGQHYYVTNPLTGSGINPKWDFTSAAFAGNPNAYVVAAKVASLSAPTGSQDIDWVYLTQITGSLANQVYRVDTRQGQPPASCTPGSAPITVKYSAKYWLYGGSIKN